MGPRSDADRPALAGVERVRTGLHLVVDGHLNPMIFSPTWFQREGLMREEEVEYANERLKAEPSFVAFQTQHISLVVSQNNLELFSNNEGLELTIRDLLLNVFTLLRHTPLTTLTIARSAHIAFIRGGRDAGLKPNWPALACFDAFEDHLDSPELTDVSFRSHGGFSGDSAETFISIQPSQVPNADVFVECRYSTGLDGDEEKTSVDVLHLRLKDEMMDTRRHSEATFDHFSDLLRPENDTR